MALDENKAREIAQGLVGREPRSERSILRDKRYFEFFSKFYARIMVVMTSPFPDIAKMDAVSSIARRVLHDKEATFAKLQARLHYAANIRDGRDGGFAYTDDPFVFLGGFSGRSHNSDGIKIKFVVTPREMVLATGWTQAQWLSWVDGDDVPEPGSDWMKT